MAVIGIHVLGRVDFDAIYLKRMLLLSLVGNVNKCMATNRSSDSYHVIGLALFMFKIFVWIFPFSAYLSRILIN